MIIIVISLYRSASDIALQPH